MRPQPGQLERSLAEITIGHDRMRKRRHEQDRASGGHEAEQQIRVPVAGSAGPGWSFVETEVGFEYPFLWMPTQRQAPFETPHFGFGFDFEGNGSIVGHASVLQWVRDSSENVIGAKVQIGIQAPTTSSEVAFKATVHLRFQGYAADYEEGFVG